MRTIGRWLATFVVVMAGCVAILALFLWTQTAWLPYNTEGRYFDPEEEIAYTDAEPQFFALAGWAALVLGGAAVFLKRKLRRR